MGAGVSGGDLAGVVGGAGDHRTRLSSLSLLNTKVFASSHVGIAGIFGAGAAEFGAGLGVVGDAGGWSRLSSSSLSLLNTNAFASSHVGTVCAFGARAAEFGDGAEIDVWVGVGVVVVGDGFVESKLLLLLSLDTVVAVPPHAVTCGFRTGVLVSDDLGDDCGDSSDQVLPDSSAAGVGLALLVFMLCFELLV